MSDAKPIDLENATIDERAAAMLSAAQAHRMRMVACRFEGEAIVVATDEANAILADAARVLTGSDVTLAAADTDALDRALARFYPDPVYPPEGDEIERLKGALIRQGQFGLELFIAMAAQAILARRDRLRISLPWSVRMESRGDPGAEALRLDDAVDDGGKLYPHFETMLRHAAAEALAMGRPAGKFPLVFFGDRVYTVSLAFHENEIVADLEESPES